MITLEKLGDSLVIRIPKFILDELGWNEGDELLISKDKDKIIIDKPNKRKSIVELFDGYKGDYQPQEIDWGEDKGNEIINSSHYI